MDGFEAEQQLVEDFLFLGTQVVVRNQESLARQDDFDLFQLIADQRAPGADDIANRISQSDARRDFYGTGDDVQVGLYALLRQVIRQDLRVRRCDCLPLEPLNTSVFLILRDGEREAAFAETQALYEFCLATFLDIFVLAHDAHVGHAIRYRLRDVVVAQEKNLHGEALGGEEQDAFAPVQLDARFFEEHHRLVVETAFRLYCYS